MAASVISSVQELYGTLSFSGKPKTLWFGTAPLKNPDGTAVTLPAVEMFHEGTPGGVTLEYDPVIDWLFRFEAWAETEAACEALVFGMLFNGAAPGTHAGFAYGTVTISSPWTFESFEMEQWPVFEMINTSRTAPSTPVFHAVWKQNLKVYRSA